MEISQELEDRLVGIAVVNGHWYAAVRWLQATDQLVTAEIGKPHSIVANISRKYKDLHLPTCGNTLDLMKYLDDHIN